ncbi:MAG: 4-hydroxy-tetrahydrodipicolinate synthase [Acidimicrobiia bacterium]|nr:4-hydroxy-tetrahydrodipicolinate synthase [Acidimicrobiia bacterium]
MSRFGRVLTAMATPFGADGSLDLDGAANLARWLVSNGNDGVVVAGTTGEAPTLSKDEHLDLIRTVRDALPDAVVVAGAGSNDTRHAIEMTDTVTELGVDAVLSVSPYYNRPPQSGIEAHFRAIAAATDLPIMIYDVPGRTGRRIGHDVLVRLFSEVENCVAFKDATGDPAGTARLMAAVPHVDLYSGDDSLTLPLLAVGAIGIVGTSTHWTAPHMAELIIAFEKGDVARAREINAQLQDSFEYVNSDRCVFSQAVKVMMNRLGVPVGECRLPLGPPPGDTDERARIVIEALHG